VAPAVAFPVRRISACRENRLGPRGLVLSAHGALQRRSVRYRPRPKLVAAVDQTVLLHRATLSLAEERPQLSARQVVTRGQTIFFGGFAAVVIAAFVAWPAEAADLVVAGMSIGFVASLVLRCGLAVVGRQLRPDAALGQGEPLPSTPSWCRSIAKRA